MPFKKILFVTNHRRDRSPGQRFRFEQYLDYMNQQGFLWELSYLFSEKGDKIFYSKGHYFQKLYILYKAGINRFKDVMKASGYDIIFIQREAFKIGWPVFEYLLSKSKAKLIFDFDDSIWLNDVTEANKSFAWVKYPQKTPKIIRYSDMIFAGNRFLVNYALQYNSNVKLMPTTIDTTRQRKTFFPGKNPDKICIGWTGSITTIRDFELAIPALLKIKEKYGDKVYFKAIGDEDYYNAALGIKGLPWQHATEIHDLSEIDIGIMPLPHNDWARGKCGLKGLQYMAMEMPTIMSPVGVNTEIITDGINGFLADSTDEWISKLSLLIESKELRERLGRAGRETVEKFYSVNSQKDNYIRYFNELLNLTQP